MSKEYKVISGRLQLKVAWIVVRTKMSQCEYLIQRG